MSHATDPGGATRVAILLAFLRCFFTIASIAIGVETTLYTLNLVNPALPVPSAVFGVVSAGGMLALAGTILVLAQLMGEQRVSVAALVGYNEYALLFWAIVLLMAAFIALLRDDECGPLSPRPLGYTDAGLQHASNHQAGERRHSSHAVPRHRSRWSPLLF